MGSFSCGVATEKAQTGSADSVLQEKCLQVGGHLAESVPERHENATRSDGSGMVEFLQGVVQGFAFAMQGRLKMGHQQATLSNTHF